MTSTTRLVPLSHMHYKHMFYVFLLSFLSFYLPTLSADDVMDRMNADEALTLVDATISTKGCHFDDLLSITETNENSFVIGLLAASNNIARPPSPTSEYVFRVWIDRNTRQIIPSPAWANRPMLSVSNVVDIVHHEDPSFSYGTNDVVALTYLSETTIARFPAKKPDVIPPGCSWLGPDFASIVWIDNSTTNILLWLEGN